MGLYNNNVMLMLFVKAQTSLADWITVGAFSGWRRNFEEERERNRILSLKLKQLTINKNRSSDFREWLSSRCVRICTTSGGINNDGQQYVPIADYRESTKKIREAIELINALETSIDLIRHSTLNEAIVVIETMEIDGLNAEQVVLRAMSEIMKVQENDYPT